MPPPIQPLENWFWRFLQYVVTWLIFYGKKFSAPRPTPKLENRPLSAVRDCLFNIFAVTLHIRRPLLHPQPEDVPCRGDKDPLITATGIHLSILCFFPHTKHQNSFPQLSGVAIYITWIDARIDCEISQRGNMHSEELTGCVISQEARDKSHLHLWRTLTQRSYWQIYKSCNELMTFAWPSYTALTEEGTHKTSCEVKTSLLYFSSFFILVPLNE
jgi:hypothetical protein